jgi:hypothetical protein
MFTSGGDVGGSDGNSAGMVCLLPVGAYSGSRTGERRRSTIIREVNHGHVPSN